MVGSPYQALLDLGRWAHAMGHSSFMAHIGQVYTRAAPPVREPSPLPRMPSRSWDGYWGPLHHDARFHIDPSAPSPWWRSMSPCDSDFYNSLCCCSLLNAKRITGNSYLT